MRRLDKEFNALRGTIASISGTMGVSRVADVAAVRALTTRYMLVVQEDEGWVFYWDPDNAGSDDSSTIIKPTDEGGDGRYVRLV